jgi:putative ABC transport system ATP-binding protein
VHVPKLRETSLTELVRVDAATKRYERSEPAALESVNLSIEAGEAIAVMGPSGSGKSTLLNLIAGLDRPTSGTVTVAGETVSALSETKLAIFRRRRIGVIFQFFNLLEDLTARDNVVLPAQLLGTSRRTARQRAMELLTELGVEDKANMYPAHLSGGERQRVAIARALINRPALLLADEPTGALDAQTGEHVANVLSSLNRRGQTLLLVTHDAAVAGRCATRVIELMDGQLVSGAQL